MNEGQPAHGLTHAIFPINPSQGTGGTINQVDAHEYECGGSSVLKVIG